VGGEVDKQVLVKKQWACSSGLVGGITQLAGSA